jgi:hypothetical protein
VREHAGVARIRLEDIPTKRLAEMFDFFLGGFPNTPNNPETGHTVEDLYDIQQIERVKIKYFIRNATTLDGKSEGRHLLNTVNDHIERITEEVCGSVPLRMRTGQSIAVGRLGRRHVLIPKSAWFGRFDWRAETLTSGRRQYKYVRIIPPTISEEQAVALNDLYKKANPDLEEITGVTSPLVREEGRPTLKDLHRQKCEEMRDTRVLEPTLIETARYIAAWKRREHPEVPPAAAKTIEKHISAIYNAAPSGSRKLKK